MNTRNLTYSEIQNLFIQDVIEAYTSQNETLQVSHQTSFTNVPSTRKPLPSYNPSVKTKTITRTNVNKRIRLRNHTNRITANYLLVKDSVLVNPEQNVISIYSPIGRILNSAESGDNFSYSGNEYTVIDIFNTPEVQTA